MKITQIAVAPNGTLYALTDEGAVLERTYAKGPFGQLSPSWEPLADDDKRSCSKLVAIKIGHVFFPSPSRLEDSLKFALKNLGEVQVTEEGFKVKSQGAVVTVRPESNKLIISCNTETITMQNEGGYYVTC